MKTVENTARTTASLLVVTLLIGVVFRVQMDFSSEWSFAMGLLTNELLHGDSGWFPLAVWSYSLIVFANILHALYREIKGIKVVKLFFSPVLLLLSYVAMLYLMHTKPLPPGFVKDVNPSFLILCMVIVYIKFRRLSFIGGPRGIFAFLGKTFQGKINVTSFKTDNSFTPNTIILSDSLDLILVIVVRHLLLWTFFILLWLFFSWEFGFY